MSHPIATINGKAVYSNKKISGISNTRITFSDGSWCDVATGEVVNNGAGYISIGTPATDGDTYKSTLGPKVFSARSLGISNINADVEVSVIDGDAMVVTVEGPQSEIDAIDVSLSGNTLTIQDKGGKRGGSNINMIGISNISIGGSINISSSGIRISTGGGESETKLTVGVPLGSPIRISGVQGKTIIGDTEGQLHASVLGSQDIRAGKVGDATLSVQGSGDIIVGAVQGNLSMSVQGSGDIHVKDGSVNLLSANVMGSGDARFDGNAVDASLSLMGSGDIDIKFVKNKPSTSAMGSGDITIGNW